MASRVLLEELREAKDSVALIILTAKQGKCGNKVCLIISVLTFHDHLNLI